MTFLIDTGAPTAPTIIDQVPEWFRDILPETATEQQVAHDFAYHMIGEMKSPKTLKTVRKHLLAKWQFLSMLADQQPDVFDEVMQAYAERSLIFEAAA